VSNFALGIFRPINELEKHPLNKSYLRGSSNDPTDDALASSCVFSLSLVFIHHKSQTNTGIALMRFSFSPAPVSAAAMLRGEKNFGDFGRDKPRWTPGKSPVPEINPPQGALNKAPSLVCNAVVEMPFGPSDRCPPRGGSDVEGAFILSSALTRGCLPLRVKRKTPRPVV